MSCLLLNLQGNLQEARWRPLHQYTYSTFSSYMRNLSSIDYVQPNYKVLIGILSEPCDYYVQRMRFDNSNNRDK